MSYALFTGLLSLLFVKSPEAGFAHYNVWQAVAYSVSFTYTTFLCFSVKTYIFIGAILATLLCYVCLEIRIRKSPKGYQLTETIQVKRTEDDEKEEIEVLGMDTVTR